MAINQALPLLVVQNLLARAETQMLRPSLLDIPKERWPLIGRKDYVQPISQRAFNTLERASGRDPMDFEALKTGQLGHRTSL